MITFCILISGVAITEITGPFWIRMTYGAIVSLVGVAILFRFGLLALGASGFSASLLQRLPITLDPGVWYFGRSLFGLTLLMALALYAFFTSLGGKRWLPEIAVDT